MRSEIIHSLKIIKANFDRIEEIIKKVNFELELFSNKIREFQKAPAKFREDLNEFIEEFRFNETEIELNNEYRNILNQIKAFNKRLNKFEYKRLAFNLIEDWEETKLQVIDELSLIKGFISELCEEKKEEFSQDLKNGIRVFYDRISILRVQYDVLKEYNFPDNLDELIFTEPEDKELEEKFNQITQLRNYLFKLDDEIRELILNNVEFDIFKDLLRTWVGVKIEIQEYLSTLDKKIKNIKDKLVEYFIEIQNRKQNIETKMSNITNELGFQLFQGHIHSIISQGIEGFKNFNENFENLNKKINQLIKKTEFNDAKKIIEMSQKQIQNFIEDYENQIDTIIGKITDDNNIFDLYIRPLLTKFIESKELLIIKSKSFKQKNLERLYLNQINYYLEVMNPIKINNLASYLDLEVDQLNELLLNFINKNKLNAKIIEDKLHSPKMEDLYESKDLLLFRTTKTIGNLITLDFKLSNPTSLPFRDLQLTLKIPIYMSFVKKESFPRILFINELKSGNAFKFRYLLKRNRIVERKFSDPSSDQITLNIYYKDPFNITRKITKKIDLLLP